MADSISPERRSQIMSCIRSKDTRPEMLVRRMVHGMGYRYRLHDRKLPGCPDMVFATRRAVIFIHGCYWHQHPGCKRARVPKSRIDYWGPKLERNRSRDLERLTALRRLGWRVLVIWECQTSGAKTSTWERRLRGRLVRFLGLPAADRCNSS